MRIRLAARTEAEDNIGTNVAPIALFGNAQGTFVIHSDDILSDPFGSFMPKVGDQLKLCLTLVPQQE